MGWTVLYIAFGVVALWLLGEVLLQYKARLRWRVLAFCGFLGVVMGVLMSLVAVIIAGAVAFAVGQTYVTLSFRRGFSTGWAIGGNPGASRRRRSGPPAQAGPTLEVTELSYSGEDAPYDGREGAGEQPAAETTAVYEPLPMPDDTGQYGVYGTGQDTAHGGTGHDAHGTGYDPAYDPYAQSYEQQQPAYDYGAAAAQQQYAAYSDPYIGPGTDGQQYGAYYADPYAASSYSYDTPPGGVWVPQQRDTEPAPQPQPGTPGPFGYEPHQDDQQQYRY
ncbi:MULTISPECIES: hypothetical protein [Streptomyces]|uniref:hypothetical protein n=1 Tax=Streptomyces TaxID=1883 RepID=UPI00093D3F23|nr:MULTISPECIES: hypothetical protein [Streptomyces]MBX9425736.1 hypothetical protein [Streptomyces lateritius]OKJ69147.1 hypothetical protein AMK29_01485 [Streptomyces sp. CB02261]